MPPPNESIGSITDGSTSIAETFRQQNWERLLPSNPAPPSGRERRNKVTGHAGAIQSSKTGTIA
jgi:hypothetical protein